MGESIAFSRTADRKITYNEIIPQIDSLVSGESDVVANLANIVAVLKEVFGFFWVGFYLVKGNELVLGPFQGPLACTRIKFTEGVCGHCYSTRETVVVPDVDKFPGHIACNSAARSEIVVPIFSGKSKVAAVLDVDSDKLNDFGDVDRDSLGTVARIVERVIRSHTNSERLE
jgi:GAF domain-containing protein